VSAELKQKRGLADARLTAEEDERAGHESSAENAVELRRSEAQAWRSFKADMSQLLRRNAGRIRNSPGRALDRD